MMIVSRLLVYVLEMNEHLCMETFFAMCLWDFRAMF